MGAIALSGLVLAAGILGYANSKDCAPTFSKSRVMSLLLGRPQTAFGTDINDSDWKGLFMDSDTVYEFFHYLNTGITSFSDSASKTSYQGPYTLPITFASVNYCDGDGNLHVIPETTVNASIGVDSTWSMTAKNGNNDFTNGENIGGRTFTLTPKLETTSAKNKWKAEIEFTDSLIDAGGAAGNNSTVPGFMKKWSTNPGSRKAPNVPNTNSFKVALTIDKVVNNYTIKDITNGTFKFNDRTLNWNLLKSEGRVTIHYEPLTGILQYEPDYATSGKIPDQEYTCHVPVKIADAPERKPTINFDTNGGSVTSGSSSNTYVYTFTGWDLSGCGSKGYSYCSNYVNHPGNNNVEAGTNMIFRTSITQNYKILKATWEDPQPFNIPTVYRRGYDLSYWSNNDGYNPLSANATQFNEEIVDAKTTYTAQWTPQHFYVDYDANFPANASTKQFGTNNVSSSDFIYDQSNQLSSSTPVLPGYKFLYWNTEADGSGINYSSGAVSNNDFYQGKDSRVTLYAIWQPNTIKVQYHHNDADDRAGSDNATPTANKAISGSGIDQNTENDGERTPDGEVIALYTFDQYFTAKQADIYDLPGWSFDSNNGWSDALSKNGNHYSPGGKYRLDYDKFDAEYNRKDSNENQALKKINNSEFDLFAEWNPKTYTISYNKNKPDSSNHGLTASKSVLGDMPDTMYVYESDYGQTQQKLRDNAFTLHGWTWKNWGKDKH